MPETVESELIVLGAGPGGYAAAFLAAISALAWPVAFSVRTVEARFKQRTRIQTTKMRFARCIIV